MQRNNYKKIRYLITDYKFILFKMTEVMLKTGLESLEKVVTVICVINIV